MECGLISAPQSAFCCIRGLYNDTISVLLLALRVGAMCGTTIMTSIGLSFLFLRVLLTFSNVTTACHSASATPSSRLASPNKKSPPESSRNTTTPRSILCTRFSFDPTVPRAREHGAESRLVRVLQQDNSGDIHTHRQNLPKYQVASPLCGHLRLRTFFTICNFYIGICNFYIEKCCFYMFDF